LFAGIEVVVPQPPVGFIIQLFWVHLKMKPKERANLSAVLHSFGFIYSKRLMEFF
jgi:hypothetical protein